MIKLLTRKQYATEHWITEQAVAKAVDTGNLSKVNFEWEARDGTKYKGIFILPKQYAIVNRDQILNATKTVKALGVGSVEG